MSADEMTKEYEMLSEVVGDIPDPKEKPGNNLISNARWQVHYACEAMQPIEPIDFIIEGLITRGSVNLFYGDGGSKKTYSLIHQGVCASIGAKWLNFSTKPVRVLYIDEESGEVRFRRRLGEVMRGEGTDEAINFQYVSIAGFKLDNKADSALIEALITEVGAELVYIDALCDVMDGDENSKKDTQPVFNTARRIAEHTNSAIVIIHHSNKNGGYRGSSAIKGAVDLMVQVASIDGSSEITFQTEKARDGERVTFSAVASWNENQFYLSACDKESMRTPNEPENYVLRFLENNGPSTIEAIMAGADTVSERASKDAVYRLAKKSQIRCVNPYKKIGERAVYAIA